MNLSILSTGNVMEYPVDLTTIFNSICVLSLATIVVHSFENREEVVEIFKETLNITTTAYVFLKLNIKTPLYFIVSNIIATYFSRL